MNINNNIINKNVNLDDIASLSKHFDSLNSLLLEIKTKFKIIAITETRLLKDLALKNKCDIAGYSFLSNETEASAGGTALFISDDLNKKPREDLSSVIYISKQLESTFLEIDSRGDEGNVIVGCIYKHPGFNKGVFITRYLSKILDKANKEKKRLILLGDFNINLLEYDASFDVQQFIDTLYSHCVFPTISLSTRVTLETEMLIDNILVSSNFKKNFNTGNLIVGISDHLPQFLIFEGCENKNKKDRDVLYKDWKSFETEEFLNDFRNVDWQSIMKVELCDPNVAFENYYEKLNKLITKHLPTKKLTKKQMKNKDKPWISKGILKSLRTRDLMYSKYLKEKDPIVKTILHQRYKKYRNSLVKLIRTKKKKHYKDFFSANIKNSKNIWKGIN